MHTMRTLEAEAGPLGPKKTILVMATVVGCIAILWPKVFHPMLIGNNNPAVQDHTLPHILKDRGPGCCDVVLDSDSPQYMNNTLDLKRFRESVHLIGKDQSIRQERPLHMRPEAMHPAMRERGAPTGPTKTVVEGRPGPIPGMRPPMGGGAFQQSPPKGTNSMGLIMPLYTVFIFAFFAYTILKIVFKKNPPTQEPYVEIISQTKEPEENIIQKLSSSSSSKDQRKRPDNNGPSPKLAYDTTKSKKIPIDSAIPFESSSNLEINLKDEASPLEQKDNVAMEEDNELLDIAALKRKIAETEIAMTKIIARMSQIVPKTQDSKETPTTSTPGTKPVSTDDQQTVKILGMEVTSSCEGGKKWDPSNRIQPVPKPNPDDHIETVEAQEIYLEGTLPHESQILVADSEEHVEEESNGEGAAIILSSKMTLSLISLDPVNNNGTLLGSIEENSLKNHDRPANSI